MSRLLSEQRVVSAPILETSDKTIRHTLVVELYALSLADRFVHCFLFQDVRHAGGVETACDEDCKWVVGGGWWVVNYGFRTIND